MLKEIEKYSDIIEHVIRSTSFSSSVIDFEDLRSIAQIAALRAVKTYKSSFGRKITSYIYDVVKRDVYREAARFMGVFTVDSRKTRLAVKVKKMKESGSSYEDISKKLNIDKKQAFDLYYLYSNLNYCDLQYSDLTVNDEYYNLKVSFANATEEAIFNERIVGNSSVCNLSRDLGVSKSTIYRIEKRLKERICNV